jgi:hypothetical protein
MIYTAPCVMFWMRAYPLLGQVGGGWTLDPGIREFLGPVKNGIEPVGECHLGPKEVKISRALYHPLPLAQIMDAARIKSITHRAI